MLYIFRMGDVLYKLKINRNAKRFEVLSSVPCPLAPQAGRYFPRPYWELFGRFVWELNKEGLTKDKNKEEIKQITQEDALREMIKMEAFTNEEFEKKFIEDFGKIGAELINKIPIG